MTTHYVTPAQLGKALAKEARKAPALLARAAVRAAHRGKGRLVAATDEKGITDMGQYKNSFKVERLDEKTPAVLFNDAPMAGVIELGARPHPVSKAGREAITDWVRRKLGKRDEKEAARIAAAIVRKIGRDGQKGRFVFKDEQALLTKYWREEMERALRGSKGPR